jgi:hypothetical protein
MLSNTIDNGCADKKSYGSGVDIAVLRQVFKLSFKKYSAVYGPEHHPAPENHRP